MSKDKNEKSALAPRLRFPVFRETGKWEPKIIGDSCESFSGGTPSTAKKSFYGGEIPFIRSAEIGKDTTELFLTNEGLENSAAKMVKVNDILVALYGANSGDVALAKINGAINQAILCLRHETNNTFVYQYLVHRKDWIIATFIQGGQGNLSGEIIKAIKLCFPKSEEQQKIADCLSSLDELITAETQKLDALKTHKKGLMQRLFPREGETVPRLRFPEFWEAGEWEQKSLGEAATFYNGRAYAKEELLGRGKYKVIRVGNFFTSDKWYYSDLELDESKYCDDGDLLYAWSASFGPRIWRGNKSIYHYHIWKVVENVGVSRRFLFIALDIETERMKARSANGIGMFHITKGTIESWMSVFPTLAEQQKIADCASSLDDLITAQGQKIDTLKTHKKGLMQQLFPVLDEVQK